MILFRMCVYLEFQHWESAVLVFMVFQLGWCLHVGCH